MIVFLMCLFYSEQTLILADSETNDSEVQGSKNPSPIVQNGFFGYQESGISSNSSTNLDITRLPNTKINLNPEFVFSLLDKILYFTEPPFPPFTKPTYIWRKKINNGTWKSLDPKEIKYDQNNITATSEPSGTSYYQLEVDYKHGFIWWGLYNLSHKKPKSPILRLYSKVIAIHTAKVNKPTESINIKTDSVYLYNKKNDFDKDSTFATALITPSDSTEDIHWAIDQPNLASITDNGKIIANNNGTSGEANIWAYTKHPDGSQVNSNKIAIRIGGGLDDQTVHAGQNATFKILGIDNNDDKRDEFEKTTIDWYKKGNKSKNQDEDKKVSSNNEPNFTIQNVKAQADGEKYYAKITTVFENKSSETKKKKTITKSLTTDPATLHVIPSDDPNVTISTTLSNETKYGNKKDLDCTLNNVTTGDTVKYKIILNNTSNKIINDSTLSIPIHAHSIIQSIKVGNSDVTSKYLDTNRDPNKNTSDLTLNIGSLNNSSSKIISIVTTIQNIPERSTSTTTVHYTGTDFNKQKYKNSGPGTTINYITNKLTYQLHNINFEPINAFENNTLKYRLTENNNPNDIISIDDERRLKGHTQLFLTQTSEFIDKKKKNILNARLKFYSKNPLQSNDFTPNVPFNLEETKTSDTFQSIKWAKDEGLLLKIGNGPFKPGSYSAKLTWSFVESLK